MTVLVFDSGRPVDGLNIATPMATCARHSISTSPGYWKVWPTADAIRFFGATSAHAVIDDYGSLVRVAGSKV